MPTFKRYVVREGNRILFFTSKPKKWNRVFWQDIKKIVNIADAMLDDPKVRIAVSNHSEEEYYQKVLDEYNRLNNN